jgi:hypothetical protein
MLIDDRKLTQSSILSVAVAVSVRNLSKCFTYNIYLFYGQFAVSLASLICLAIFFVLSKCTFTIFTGAETITDIIL